MDIETILLSKKCDSVTSITLCSKSGMTFSKEHQTDACRFDVLSRSKGSVTFEFYLGYFIYLGGYFQCLELIMLVSKTKLMPSGGKGSNIG